MMKLHVCELPPLFLCLSVYYKGSVHVLINREDDLRVDKSVMKELVDRSREGCTAK